MMAKRAKSVMAANSLALITMCAPIYASAEPGAATATGIATAQVIKPLATRSLADLDFGTIAVAPGEGGSVIVGSDSTTAYIGSAKAVCGTAGSCRTHPARFRVSGEARRTYRVVVPDQVEVRGQRNMSNVLLISSLEVQSTSEPENSAGGALDRRGQDHFNVGGTLVIPAGTVSDRFRADIPVIVNYS